MDFVYLFLGFFGLLVLVALCFSIGGIISKAKDKSDAAKLTDYFMNDGKADIEKLESYLQSNKIPMPDKSDDLIQYVQNMLNNIVAHYCSNWEKSLSKGRYKRGVRIEGFGTIYYNAKKVFIYDDILHNESFFTYLQPAVKSGVQYKHTNAKRNEEYWTLEQLFAYFKRLEEPKAHISFARSIPLEDFYWYVQYPESMGHRALRMGESAVIGGVLLGPTGALIGASGSAKRQEKERAAEVVVVLGQRSVESWCVAKGEYQSKRVMDDLTNCFPENRYSDSYSKHC